MVVFIVDIFGSLLLAASLTELNSCGGDGSSGLTGVVWLVTLDHQGQQTRPGLNQTKPQPDRGKTSQDCFGESYCVHVEFDLNVTYNE